MPIHPASRTRRVLATFALSIAVTAALAGCSSFGGSGPSGKSITRTAKTDSRIKLIDLTDAVARQVMAGEQRATLAEALGDAPLRGTVVGPGDVLDVAIWEAPPAALFGTNAEVNFEATGLTLAQALGRIGGLQDNRADIKGVFIFRLEDPAVLDPALAATAQTTPDGKVPVIYRVDMGDPATFFMAQGFPIRNKDVLYVSNALLVDIQKFVNVVSSMAFSLVSVGNAVN